MGYYINQGLGPLNKARDIGKLYDAIWLPSAPAWEAIPTDRAVICVTTDGPYDSAAFCYSRAELEYFNNPGARPRTWLLMDRKLAIELTGYEEQTPGGNP